MKKITFLLLYLLLFSSINIFSQQHKINQQTNRVKLKQIAQFERNKAKLNKQIALSKAKLNNWKIILDNADGSYAELIRVDANGHPVYYKTFNRGAGITTRANQLYTGGSLGLSVEGQNMIVGEWDGGAVLATHEALTGRVVQMDSPDGTHPHSTHVAGTLIANDQVEGGSVRGMAFRATLHAYDWYEDTAEMAEAAADGLLISNHSYGYGWPDQYQFGKYDEESHTVDDIMYNAPYYLMVCAAGNDRAYGYNTGDNGYDLVTGHAVSKNSMVVAAVHEVLDYTGPSSVVMSEFSSWGPTDDGRIKPDISAKGVDVYSSVDSSNSAYDTYSGTSMASPNTAGTLLLLQQYYNEKNGSFMRSATLRGLAIHSADETGDAPGPDYRYGWGLLNAERAAEIIRDDALTSLITEETLTDANTYTITVDAMGGEPLMATVCWTDPAGDAVTDTTEDLFVRSLVNDLDIRILHNGETYYPWKLDLENVTAPATKADNDVDNVEKVEIDNPSGSYTIVVSHKGNLTGNQNFSLILSGIAFSDFYVTSTASPTQSVCVPASTADYDLHLTCIAGFNDTVQFSTEGLADSVTADFSPETMTESGDFQLNLSGLDNLSPGNYPFTIKATTASDEVEFEALLRILDTNFPEQALTSPIDNATGIDLDTPLSWEENSNAELYQLQISTDPDFNTIVVEEIIQETTHNPEGLNYNTLYYWRVKPLNSCGEGDFSPVYSFRTVCQAPYDFTFANTGLDSIDVSWIDPNGVTQWEIEVVEAGGDPTGSGTIIDTNPYTVTGLESATEYKVYVRSICTSGTSEWGSSETFLTASDFCNGDHFYDTGGPDGNYSNDETIITVIAPTEGYNSISVTFNEFSIESGWDYMYIYDGGDDNAPLIGEYTGTNSPGTIVPTNPSGTLTFKFVSDVSVTRSGWDASVTCQNITCPTPFNFAVDALNTDSADVSWTNGGSETQWQLEYGEAGFSLGTGTQLIVDTNTYSITGLNSNTSYDVYLRAICGDNPGDDDSGWLGPLTFTTIQDFCNGDHFYDTGGPGENYSNNENIVTVIAPSEGYDAISVTFNEFNVESGWDYMYIYDGVDTNAPLIGEYTGTNSPGTVEPTNPYGTLTFRFYSDTSVTRSGWDATVTCFSISCPAPTDFVVDEVNYTSAIVNWEAGGDETQWQLEYGEAGFSLGSGTQIEVNEKPYTLTGLIPGTSYDVYLRAICGDNPGDDDSMWLDPVQFATFNLSSPENLTADVNQVTGEVVLNWQVTEIDGSSDKAFLHYNIYRNGNLLGTSATMSYTDNLPAYGNYNYYVTSLYDEGESDPSNVVTVSYTGYPDISVDPASLTETLYEGQTSVQYLTVTNSGEYDLNYSIDIDEISLSLPQHVAQGTWHIEQAGHVQNTGINNGVNTEKDFLVRTYEVPGVENTILIFDNDTFEDYVTSLTNLGLSFTQVTSYSQFNSLLTNGEWDLVIFNEYGTFIDSYTLSVLNYYYLSGGKLLMSYWGVYSNPNHDLYASLGFSFVDSYNNTFNIQAVSSTHPVFNFPNVISEINPSGYHYNMVDILNVSPTTATGLALFEGLDNVPALLLSDNHRAIFNSFGTQAYYTDSNSNGKYDIKELLENEITYFSHSISWLSTDPVSGTIAPGTTAQIAVHFNAEGLEEGTYQTNININSNDPDTPVFTVSVSLTVLPNNCMTPTNFTVSNILENSVELSWENGGDETQWQLEYGIAGFELGTGIQLSLDSHPYTLTDLQENTSYDAYLRSVCDTDLGEVISDWTSLLHFHTACGISAPYLEDVESHPVTVSAEIENCWTVVPFNSVSAYRWNVTDTQTPSGNTGPDTAHSGNKFFYTEASSPASAGETAELISSMIDISALSQPELSFYYYMYGESVGALYVDLYYDNTWHDAVLSYVGQQQTSGAGQWIRGYIDLGNVGNFVQVRFRSVRGNGNFGDIAIDDISIDERVQGLDIIAAKYNFNYYPNPVADKLNLQADEEIISVQIFNLTGQEIINLHPANQKLMLDTRELKPGTYILKVNIDNATGYYRFIKE